MYQPRLHFILFLFIFISFLISCSDNPDDEMPMEMEEVECDLSLLIEEASLGTLTAVADGGTLPYDFIWSTGETQQSINPNESGEIGLTVVDAMRCEVSASYTYTNVCESLELEVNSNSMGQLTTEVSGGLAPYSYIWSNGQITQNISVTEEGDYAVTVTDSNSCTKENEVTVDQLIDCDGLQCATTSNPSGCEDNGSATVTTFGGSGGYTYEWNNGATTSLATGLAPGFYSVTVTDSEGCFTVCNVEVLDAYDGLKCTVSTTSATATAGGTATVTSTGGSGGYTYTWNNGATTSVTTDLTPGLYSVEVTDSNGCTTSCSGEVDDFCAELLCETTTTASSANMSDGSATVTAVGGSGGYTYIWSNGATTSLITNLAAGIYSVTVTDGFGCSAECEADVQ